MKGDEVTVTTLTGNEASMLATRRGRRVEVMNSAIGRVRWLLITEVTRGGKPTGSSLRVRADQVAIIADRKVEP